MNHQLSNKYPQAINMEPENEHLPCNPPKVTLNVALKPCWLG